MTPSQDKAVPPAKDRHDDINEPDPREPHTPPPFPPLRLFLVELGGSALNRHEPQCLVYAHGLTYNDGVLAFFEYAEVPLGETGTYTVAQLTRKVFAPGCWISAVEQVGLSPSQVQ